MKDVLIVGFGIAGMTVAKQLEGISKSFDIISDDSQQSSKVAGGILNPVAIKRYNLAWKAQEFMPQAIEFYKKFNSKHEVFYFNELPILKLFSSAEDQNNWIVASDQPHLEPYLNSRLQKPDSPVEANFKVGEVNQSYLLQLKGLLEYEKLRYSKSSQFITETFDYSSIKFNSDKVIYKNQVYESVVFCEGYAVVNNPFFNWLPIYGNKGEYLIFKSKDLKSNESILKAKNFIIPLGKDLYKYGATYSRENLNDLPTEEAFSELEAKLSEMINCDYKIVDQIAGVRPTVRDRKPILGVHPDYENLYILNGFGSRGIMAAPSLSNQLIGLIFEGKQIEKEISLDRFLKLYP